MAKAENENAIDAVAARWAVRLAEGSLPAAEQRELDAWLAADTRHQGALLRAEAAWQMLDRASQLKQIAIDDPAPRASRRMIVTGIAACIALAAAAGIVLTPPGFFAPGDVYETALGEMRRVPLGDGSLAAINTETRLEVSLEPKVRRVALDRGEAWFQVAKDKTRPFVVAAGRVRVRAVGTAFSVRRRADGADVIVTEGEVLAWADGADGAAQRLVAGSKAFIGDNARAARVVQTEAQIKRGLAWREGQIALDGDTLGEAVAEFNRYNAVKIVIADRALAGERLVGWFRANEPDVFAKAAATTLGARMTKDGSEIRLSRAR